MKKILIVIAACILVAAATIVYAFYFIPEPKTSLYHTTAAQIMNLQQVVTADGTVAAGTEDDLGFQKSGVISAINVKVGDHVNKGETIATLDSGTDQAALAAANATLADLSRSLTPQEMAVQQASLETAQKNALNASADAYNIIKNALTDYSNTLFTNPQSANPQLLITTQTYNQKQQIESEQIQIIVMLSKWNAEQSTASTSSAETLITDTQNYLASITTFVNDLTTAVNALAAISPSSQTSVTTYMTTINETNAALVSAVNEVTTAQTALSSAQSNYNLKLAGNSSDTIAAQAAVVQGAEATLAEDTLSAPIDGIVTEQNSNVGESIAANAPFIHIISDTPYQIDTYIPETSIGSITIGQNATVTLDAYGPAIEFPATVTTIDPGQTVINGVNTYKITLQFTKNDPRIKDGMSGNVSIIVAEKDGVVAVPASAILQNNGSTTVLVASSSILTEPITTGITGANGWVEITRGLAAGERIVTFGTQ